MTTQQRVAPGRSSAEGTVAADAAGANARTEYADMTSATPSTIRGLAWSRRGSHEIHSVKDAEAALAEPASRLWIDAADASEQELKAIAECLELHPLIIEDIIERNQRAKVEYVADTLHLVMFAMVYTDSLERYEVDVALGKRFLLTSHPAEWDPVKTSDIARLGAEHFLSIGADFMLYAIVDPIVDGYFPVLDKIGEQIDTLEDRVVGKPGRDVVEDLFRMRRELLQVRHTVTPEREVFNQLTNREIGLINTNRTIYFRDVYDHLIRISDELDTYRELVAGALETYLSTINNNLSEIMKRLTAVTAILAGVGAVAGIFGMSEAGSAFQFKEGGGFWIVTIFVLLVGVTVFAFFRKIDWI